MIVIEFSDNPFENLCPFCREGDHSNHQRPTQNQPKYGPEVEIGECRTVESITGTKCSCEFRPVGGNA